MQTGWIKIIREPFVRSKSAKPMNLSNKAKFNHTRHNSVNGQALNWLFLMLLLFLICPFCLHAQTTFEQIRIFDYFQNSFAQQKFSDVRGTLNSFNTDQFNLFFQTQLATNWTALVNFELTNSFSTSKNGNDRDHRQNKHISIPAPPCGQYR